MSALKAIQVGRRQLGLEDGDYRAILQRVTGKSSAGDMNETERRLVLFEFRRLGFGEAPRKGAVSGPFGAKIVALWLSAWNLGLARSSDDAAMIAFIERQTGIAHPRWLREAEDAAKVIEALKSWIKRGAGVVWPVRGSARDNKVAVLRAQARMLNCEPRLDLDRCPDKDIDFAIKGFGGRIRAAKQESK